MTMSSVLGAETYMKFWKYPIWIFSSDNLLPRPSRGFKNNIDILHIWLSSCDFFVEMSKKYNFLQTAL